MGLDIITTWVLIVVMSASALAALVTLVIRFRKRCKKSVHHFRRKIRGTLRAAEITSPVWNAKSSSFCIDDAHLVPWGDGQPHQTSICLEPVPLASEKEVQLDHSSICIEAVPIDNSQEVQPDNTLICLETTLIVPTEDALLDASLIFPESAPIVRQKEAQLDDTPICLESALIVSKKEVQMCDTPKSLEVTLIVPIKDVLPNDTPKCLETALIVHSREDQPNKSFIESVPLVPKDEMQSKKISICPKVAPLSPTPNVEPDPLQTNLNSLYVRNTPPIKLNSPTARLVRVKISPKPRRKSHRRSRQAAVPFQKFGIFSVSMMLMSDSHGRDISGIINEKMSLVKSSGFVYPNGTSEVVLERLPWKSRGFRVVAILVGTNDTGTDVDTAAYVGKALRSLADYQKPLVCSVPNRYDTDTYDDLIKAQNMGLKELCLHRNVVFLNLEKLARQDYTVHGLHLNLTGKIKLGDMLVKEIERMMVFRDRKTVKRDSRHRK